MSTQDFKLCWAPNCQQRGEFLAVQISTKKKSSIKVLECPSATPGSYTHWGFTVEVAWRHYGYSLEEVHANIQIEGAVLCSIVLKKDAKVASGAQRRGIASRKAKHYKDSDSKAQRCFTLPQVRPLEASNESDTGIVAVDFFTTSGDKLATFRYERRTADFVKSRGRTIPHELSAREKNAYGRLNNLKGTRDTLEEKRNKVEKEIVRAEKEWKALQAEKERRDREMEQQAEAAAASSFAAEVTMLEYPGIVPKEEDEDIQVKLEARDSQDMAELAAGNVEGMKMEQD